jgi:type I restriction enzyme S subunit
MRIWPKGGELDRDYLRMFLASPMFNSQIDRLKTGVGLQHWGPYHLSQVRIPLPAIETQRSLMARFISQEQCQRTIMRLSDNQYRLLQEHRQALISAAVTGQLGIPEAA